MTRSRIRLPLTPLEQLAGGTSISTSADVLGVSPRQLLRLRHLGLSERRADELACRVGLHPAEVWGGDWWLDDELGCEAA